MDSYKKGSRSKSSANDKENVPNNNLDINLSTNSNRYNNSVSPTNQPGNKSKQPQVSLFSAKGVKPKTATHDEVAKSKEQTTMKIKRLFDFYCQFGDRMNVKFMKSSKFHMFATDAEILDDKFTKTRLELIFTSENKHKPQMDFNAFLNTLVKVAEYKFKSSKDTSTSLNILIQRNLWPLYDRIFENNNLTTMKNNNLPTNTHYEENKTDILTTQNVQTTRKSVLVIPEIDLVSNEVEELIFITAPILYELFKVYFPHEFSMSVNENFMKESSLKAFNLFNKDFDLCPTLVNKTITFQIWQTETIFSSEESNDRFLPLVKNVDLKKNNNNNYFGRYFDFFKFLRCIIKMSEISFERMENSINRKLNSFGKFIII